MPRIAYVPMDLAEPAEIVAAVRERRGGQFINLDRLLLHSPSLAAGWNAYLGAVRGALELDPKLRELAMCVVAVINGAEYEFVHHAPVFVAAGGSDEQVRAMRDPDSAARDASLFDDAQRATIALSIEMTRNVEVRDETFERVRRSLNERHTVELVATIAAYNMVSRFLVALGVEPE
ncbi:MAG: carboxymuconolactone decarboxylase family protein [Burkholderiaceae bacterium]|nr:carboxymuconolactone decarboxylase family protein [Burkholderiaceae bacterium]